MSAQQYRSLAAVTIRGALAEALNAMHAPDLERVLNHADIQTAVIEAWGGITEAEKVAEHARLQSRADALRAEAADLDAEADELIPPPPPEMDEEAEPVLTADPLAGRI